MNQTNQLKIKLNVVRVKHLNSEVFELVTERSNIKFIPGDVLIINASGQERPYFIASGIQEPWLRFLIRKSLSPVVNHLSDLTLGSRITVLKNPISIFPNLIKEADNKLTFFAAGIGISPVFSFLSTYPKIQPDIFYYDKNHISDSWLKKYPGYRNEITPDIILDYSNMNKKNKYYLCGQESIVTQYENIINKKVNQKRIFSYPFI
ncbi:MAG: hypothetical protein ACFFKA_00705 [Candidatus Thorarchaeota archaeon]